MANTITLPGSWSDAVSPGATLSTDDGREPWCPEGGSGEAGGCDTQGLPPGTSDPGGDGDMPPADKTTKNMLMLAGLAVVGLLIASRK